MIEDIQKLVQLKLVKSEKLQTAFQYAQKQTSLAEQQREQRQQDLAAHEVYRQKEKKSETDQLMACKRVGKQELLKYRERMAGLAARSAELALALEASNEDVEKARNFEQTAYKAKQKAQQELEKIQTLREELGKQAIEQTRLITDRSQDDLVSDITAYQFVQQHA